ncbi:polysaccharide deacetylase family protein [Leptospira levettii]|uniref:polysaccharide deacetylase family protein n=1 Tax=Leptospira levettii TaxID=2023178 RepID=UPI00223CAC7A|nr:polysaccharide deacetylase family protein [Leptospira levettii]MCW7497038.1 polysaccharide deacetylase family protein [Leptospira levettii]
MKKFAKIILEIIFGSKFFSHLSYIMYYRWVFPYIQVVTYHDTPNKDRDLFRKQLEWYQKQYVNCSVQLFKDFLKYKKWPFDKPGLIISFDDGLKSNFNMAIPLLEEFGFTGWFMVPPGFIELNAEAHSKFCNDSLIDYQEVPGQTRIGATWEDIKQASQKGHQICSHSMNHKRLSDQLTFNEVDIEILESKNLLENKLGIEIEFFTWVGGEESSYGKTAFEKMLEAGYEYIFCTNCSPVYPDSNTKFLERYHVDSWSSLRQLRFILQSGLYDISYLFKRRRIMKKLLNALSK